MRDVRIFSGAGLVVPVAGDINFMPALMFHPTFRNIDVYTNTGRVHITF